MTDPRWRRAYGVTSEQLRDGLIADLENDIAFQERHISTGEYAKYGHDLAQEQAYLADCREKLAALQREIAP